MFPTYQALKRFLARLRDPPKASDTRDHTPFGNTQSITLQSFSLVCSVGAVADLSGTQKVRDTKRWGPNPRREGGITEVIHSWLVKRVNSAAVHEVWTLW